MVEMQTIRETLNAFLGKQNEYITAELVYNCEAHLNYTQRMVYVDHVSALVAANTYKKVNPDSPDAGNVFYYNMLHLSVEDKAEMLYYTLRGEE